MTESPHDKSRGHLVCWIQKRSDGSCGDKLMDSDPQAPDNILGIIVRKGLISFCKCWTDFMLSKERGIHDRGGYNLNSHRLFPFRS